MNQLDAMPTRRIIKKVSNFKCFFLAIDQKTLITCLLTFIGKANKKDSSPAPSNVVAEKATNGTNDAVDALSAVPIEVFAAQAVAVQKESPKNTANKEKMNKKKRSDALLIQQLGNFNSDSIPKRKTLKAILLKFNFNVYFEIIVFFS